MRIFTYSTGWTAVAALCVAICAPFVIRLTTGTAPRPWTWRAHYWLAAVAVSVGMGHGIGSILRVGSPLSVVVGLWLASAAMWLLPGQAFMGGVLGSAVGRERRRIRRWHLWISPLIIGLVVAHVVLNWQYVAAPAG